MRSYRVWRPEEERALRLGVLKHGLGAWEAIRADASFTSCLKYRTGVQLKDKWRNLVKFHHLSPDEMKQTRESACRRKARRSVLRGPALAQQKRLTRRKLAEDHLDTADECATLMGLDDAHATALIPSGELATPKCQTGSMEGTDVQGKCWMSQACGLGKPAASSCGPQRVPSDCYSHQDPCQTWCVEATTATPVSAGGCAPSASDPEDKSKSYECSLADLGGAIRSLQGVVPPGGPHGEDILKASLLEKALFESIGPSRAASCDFEAAIHDDRRLVAASAAGDECGQRKGLPLSMNSHGLRGTLESNGADLLASLEAHSHQTNEGEACHWTAWTYGPDTSPGSDISCHDVGYVGPTHSRQASTGVWPWGRLTLGHDASYGSPCAASPRAGRTSRWPSCGARPETLERGKATAAPGNFPTAPLWHAAPHMQETPLSTKRAERDLAMASHAWTGYESSYGNQERREDVDEVERVYEHRVSSSTESRTRHPAGRCFLEKPPVPRSPQSPGIPLPPYMASPVPCPSPPTAWPSLGSSPAATPPQCPSPPGSPRPDLALLDAPAPHLQPASRGAVLRRSMHVFGAPLPHSASRSDIEGWRMSWPQASPHVFPYSGPRPLPISLENIHGGSHTSWVGSSSRYEGFAPGYALSQGTLGTPEQSRGIGLARAALDGEDLLFSGRSSPSFLHL